MTTLSKEQQTEFEAAAFRRLVAHLRERSDVQNIDLMNLAGFCRNCLSNWYREAAEAEGVAVTRDESREMVYGMPYEDWKNLHQNEASPVQKAAFELNNPHKYPGLPRTGLTVTPLRGSHVHPKLITGKSGEHDV